MRALLLLALLAAMAEGNASAAGSCDFTLHLSGLSSLGLACRSVDWLFGSGAALLLRFSIATALGMDPARVALAGVDNTAGVALCRGSPFLDAVNAGVMPPTALDTAACAGAPKTALVGDVLIVSVSLAGNGSTASVAAAAAAARGLDTAALSARYRALIAPPRPPHGSAPSPAAQAQPAVALSRVGSVEAHAPLAAAAVPDAALDALAPGGSDAQSDAPGLPPAAIGGLAAALVLGAVAGVAALVLASRARSAAVAAAAAAAQAHASSHLRQRASSPRLKRFAGQSAATSLGAVGGAGHTRGGGSMDPHAAGPPRLGVRGARA